MPYLGTECKCDCYKRTQRVLPKSLCDGEKECVREKERERVCVYDRERRRVFVCVCVRERARERERDRETEIVCEGD